MNLLLDWYLSWPWWLQAAVPMLVVSVLANIAYRVPSIARWTKRKVREIRGGSLFPDGQIEQPVTRAPREYQWPAPLGPHGFKPTEFERRLELRQRTTGPEPQPCWSFGPDGDGRGQGAA